MKKLALILSMIFSLAVWANPLLDKKFKEANSAYEKGKYEVLEFVAEITKKYLEIDFEAKFGSDWKSSEKEISLIIHNLNAIPKKIKIDGKRKSVSSKNNSIEIPLKWNPKKEFVK